tara:strand:- start:72 stop:650 length:579 start_codon:yes stop_codon:yes gene_type:complete
MSAQNNVFETLDKVDVSKRTEKKGNFTYLSWAWAVRELLKVAPDATWEVHEYDDGLGNGFTNQPYMTTDAGCFVKVTLTVNGIDRTQVHPVLDNRNKTVEKPNAFQINTSIQRCLAKAIALHGLGLYIFAGEDLPGEPERLNDDQIKELLNYAGKLDKTKSESIVKKIDDNEINESNYKSALAKAKRLAGAK